MTEYITEIFEVFQLHVHMTLINRELNTHLLGPFLKTKYAQTLSAVFTLDPALQASAAHFRHEFLSKSSSYQEIAYNSLTPNRTYLLFHSLQCQDLLQRVSDALKLTGSNAFWVSEVGRRGGISQSLESLLDSFLWSLYLRTKMRMFCLTIK